MRNSTASPGTRRRSTSATGCRRANSATPSRCSTKGKSCSAAATKSWCRSRASTPRCGTRRRIITRSEIQLFGQGREWHLMKEAGGTALLRRTACFFQWYVFSTRSLIYLDGNCLRIEANIPANAFAFINVPHTSHNLDAVKGDNRNRSDYNNHDHRNHDCFAPNKHNQNNFHYRRNIHEGFPL